MPPLIRVLPRFRSSLLAEIAMEVGDGGAWRIMSEVERLAVLSPPNETARLPCLGFFEIPFHLHRRWLESAALVFEAGAATPDYRLFVEETLEFLRFKKVDLPSVSRCDVVVTNLPTQDDLLPGVLSEPVVAINLGGDSTWLVCSASSEASTAMRIELPSRYGFIGCHGVLLQITSRNDGEPQIFLRITPV